MANYAVGPAKNADALALRVAELSSVLKQQRDELDEQRTLLEHNRKIVRDHEEIIRMQEAQLIERDAQLQAANAEIRALRKQHQFDAEALRRSKVQIEGKLRPSGSMGVPHVLQQPSGGGGRRRGNGMMASGASSPSKMSSVSDADGILEAVSGSPPGSPDRRNKPSTPSSTRKQLQQAIADKVVLVRALHQLTAEMAEARAEARKYAAVSERSLSTAWRLGQLGQLGLALLEVGDEEGDEDGEEGVIDEDRWEELMEATQASPPLTSDRLLPPSAAMSFQDETEI